MLADPFGHGRLLQFNRQGYDALLAGWSLLSESQSQQIATRNLFCLDAGRGAGVPELAWFAEITGRFRSCSRLQDADAAKAGAGNQHTVGAGRTSCQSRRAFDLLRGPRP